MEDLCWEVEQENERWTKIVVKWRLRVYRSEVRILRKWWLDKA